jgi:hypothetical protein
MQKNVAGQKWRVFAFDRSSNVPKTGDAANITASISIDGAALTGTNDTNPTELADGFYEFDLTQAETNGDSLLISPSSVTASIQVVGCPACISTNPASWGDDVIQTGDNFARIGVAGVGLTNIGDSRMANLDATVSSRLAPAGTLAAVTLVNGIANDVIDSDVLAATAITEIGNGAADAVWDEAASDHNSAGSFGKFIRQIKEGVVSAESTVNDVSATTLSFVTNLTEATDDHYNDKILTFIDGALAGQSRVITDYNGTTKAITFDEALTEAPADTDGFIILAIHQHSTTQIAEATRSEMDSNSTQLTAIVADTNELQTDWANGGRLDVILDELTTQGDTNETKIDTIDTNVDAIKVITDALGSTAAANLALSAGSAGIISFTAQAGTLSTTQATTDLSEATDDHYIGRVIIWLTGNLAGQATDITDYAGTGGLLTFTAVTETVVAGDTGIIVCGSQTTRLGVSGFSRGLYSSFSGKTEVVLVTGPGCFTQGEVHLGGFKAFDITFPSFPEGEVYLPGFQEGERDC